MAKTNQPLIYKLGVEELLPGLDLNSSASCCPDRVSLVVSCLLMWVWLSLSLSLRAVEFKSGLMTWLSPTHTLCSLHAHRSNQTEIPKSTESIIASSSWIEQQPSHGGTRLFLRRHKAEIRSHGERRRPRAPPRPLAGLSVSGSGSGSSEQY